jgi:hypothetical protein
MGFFSTISDPQSVITAIESGVRFPEVVKILRDKYGQDIQLFARLVRESQSSGELLGRIRSSGIPAAKRMSLLKIFRRAVSGVCDTEATKKINTISTDSIVDAYGYTFKPISKLQEQFGNLDDALLAALAVSIGEYDNRGQQGYVLTGMFFDWFEDKFNGSLSITGPRGAGPDVELSSAVSGFNGSCPCDFVITDDATGQVVAVGFARYDSTRGGAQSDDRTGGNTNKVAKIREFHQNTGKLIRVVFLSDGPGLTHNDTWIEACELDAIWDDNVRVSTIKLCDDRLTLDWLRGS